MNVTFLGVKTYCDPLLHIFRGQDPLKPQDLRTHGICYSHNNRKAVMGKSK